MSGICGALALDDSQVSRGDLEPVLDRLRRRGPDGDAIALSGPAVLGHTLLATTPEAEVEKLPLRDDASGCVITADVRLDNRDDLLAALDLDAAARIIGDGELILRAYLRWGDDCPQHLLGDFAFAIWDPRAERLFCARDHMGMRQLTYCHRPGHAFVFATEPDAVIAHAAVPKAINEDRIIDFLDDLEGHDLTSTFFEAVHRLPPAHCLTVDRAGLSLHRYWQLEPGPELKLPSDEAYAEAFLEVFTEAVRCRLRSAGPVGSMLSGGMDSGSVVAVASALLAAEGRGPLHTFSAIGPDPETCIETRTIHAAMTIPGIAPHTVNHAELDAYIEDLTRLTKDSAEPFDAHMTLVRAVYIAARRAGIKVVLDGVNGDVPLSSTSYVWRLLRRGRVRLALKEAAGEAHFWGRTWPPRKVVSTALWHAFAPRTLQNLRRKLVWKFADWHDDRSSRARPTLAIRLRQRRNEFRKQIVPPRVTDRVERAAWSVHNHVIVGRERYDRVASASAIEPRDPFMDIRLLKFCLSLPLGQLQRCGWPKFVLREAMKEKLLDSVIWRSGKEHLGCDWTKALFSDASCLRVHPASSDETIDAYMNSPAKPMAMDIISGSKQFADWPKAVYLDNWLNRTAAAKRCAVLVRTKGPCDAR